MFESFNNLMSDIIIGPERRKVKKYFDTATRDTVYADLAKILSWKLEKPQLLQDTFNKYCIEDPLSHGKSESFHSHIRTTHSARAISDAAVALLWGSFHFYAYHPFPRDSQRHPNVDFEAFRRAALLTVFQCDGLLGTRELDWYWRENGAFFHKAGLTRVFRSIAILADEFWEQESPTVSDAMDVLVMLGPQFIHAIPSGSQLEAVSRKLFTDWPAVEPRNVVKQEDISILMDLLIRLRLHERRWANYYHFGTVVEADSTSQDLTRALVNSLTEKCGEQKIKVQHLSGYMDLMPNLVLRFQQLWAVLFQPSGAADASKSLTNEAEQACIGGAISLFAPHFIVDHAGRQRPDSQDTRLMLETVQVSPDSQDITMLRLSQNLSNNSTGHIVLFTTTVYSDIPKTTIGAYLPVPSTDKVTSAYLPIQLDVSHVLFQLQPRFRLLRWVKPWIRLGDLLRSEWKVSSNKDVLEEDAELPYWVGAPRRDIGLRVDPKERVATLTSSKNEDYLGVPIHGAGNSEASWNVAVQNAQMDIFSLPGARNRNRSAEFFP
ncbi:hypothetical protein F4678DRAFT_482811 [Xylaria arbuscula]|nr:hypothetical protein F4678DRAFT_482811 [Xylaria arbuscula]